MSWKAKAGREQEVLVSIVTTLLALAALAEKAAGDSPWVRWCVLWAARQADLIVREFVGGSEWNPAGRLWSPALPNVRYGAEPADALDLAASLRALAVVVQCMAAYLRRVSVWQQGQATGAESHDGRLHHHLLLRRASAALLLLVEPRDTS
nr:hypothetical protein [Mesorhizobium sp.]